MHEISHPFHYPGVEQMFPYAEEEMEGCRPLIKPCRHGHYKVSCSCGYRIHPRFRSLTDAEAAWARHANEGAGA